MKQCLVFIILTLTILNACAQKVQKIENIKAFTKAYGYVKYFHPSDEASKIDWKKYSIYGAQEIEKCKTKEEVVETLNRLFIPIAPSIIFSDSENKSDFNIKTITPDIPNEYQLIYWQHNGVSLDMNYQNGVYESRRPNRTKNSAGEELFNFRPAFGEIINKEISDGIYCQIPLVLYGDSINTYPRANTDLLEKLDDELEKCVINPEFLANRLGNIINAYNVFQHFYPYFDVVDVDWDNELENALLRCYSDNTKNDHLITLQKFTAPLKDGHIRISGDSESNFAPPIAWEWVENQLVISSVGKGVIQVKVGDVITHINGQDSEDYFKEIKSRISAGTQGWLNHRAQYISLLGDLESKLTLTIDNNTVELVRFLKTRYSNPTAFKNREEYRIIEDNIYYLNLDVIKMETIKKLLPDLDKSNAIICDLRGYPNRNHEFISYLLKSNDTTSAWMQIPQIVYPDHLKTTEYSNNNWIEMMKVNKPYLGDKKVIFIINGQAISYAESYMGYIEGYKLATIVGQPTAGTNGNVNSFNLPGGYTISWTGMKVLKHDGSQHHGIGVLPNVYVNRTIQGIKEGRDEFLEKAVEIAKQESPAPSKK